MRVNLPPGSCGPSRWRSPKSSLVGGACPIPFRERRSLHCTVAGTARVPAAPWRSLSRRGSAAHRSPLWRAEPSPLLLRPVPGCAPCPRLSQPLAGREGVQVRGVRAGVHPAGQHEAAHADPHQRPSLPVPHLLQDVRAEADAQDPHDCALTGEAIQMQGTVGGPGGGQQSRGWGLAGPLVCCAPRESRPGWVESSVTGKQFCDASLGSLGQTARSPVSAQSCCGHRHR